MRIYFTPFINSYGGENTLNPLTLKTLQMKKLFAPLLVLVLFGFGVAGEKLTDEERSMVVQKLTDTHEYLMTTVDGLSEAQLNYKSSPEAWSIANCLEHITISENALADLLKGTLESTQDEAMRAAVTMTDEELYGMIASRDKKVTTSEPFEPSGKFGTFKETLVKFTAKRTEHIEFMKTSEADFRNYFSEMPFGTIDAYQLVLFMAGHTERHVKQMEEVKADENFPTE